MFHIDVKDIKIETKNYQNLISKYLAMAVFCKANSFGKHICHFKISKLRNHNFLQIQKIALMKI
jgi:hypothetical protein